MATPWYLAPNALALIAQIRATAPVAEDHARHHVITTDRWQTYTGADVEALTRIYDTASDRVSGADFPEFYQSGNAMDVVAAVTGTRLSGVHFLRHEARLEVIRDAVDAALVRKAA